MNKKILWAVTGIALAVLLGGCALAENDPVRIIPIMEPYISVQPRSHTFNINDYKEPPTLTVEVSNWKKPDGKISYQWYRFTNMAEYCADPVGGTAIDGQTGTSYRPSGIRAEADRIYYFYVTVTNDYPDSSTNKKAVIRSDVAIISFHNNGTAPYPVITKHPADADYILGRTQTISPLEVSATINPSLNEKGEEEVKGTLTYQWYTNTTFSATGGTAIEDADKSSYMPTVDSLKKGENYFYVTVTNTESLKTTTEITCIPVTINMKPGVRAATPRITVQPRSRTVFTNTNITQNPVVLSVKAESGDGGDITYQWYSVSKAAPESATDNLNPQAIGEPTTDETFTPAIDTTSPFAAGTTERNYFFRAEVINTNEDVTEETTAKVWSKIVTVKVVASAAANADAEANMTINIADPTKHENLQQYIRGFGGMDVAWSNFPNTRKEDTERQYNPDWGFGYNILRIMIVPPGTSQGNYTSHKDIIEGRPRDAPDFNGWSGLLPNHRPDYIENVKIVNKYGGYVLASPWTPPKEWKSNNSINSGGHLIPTYYKAFGTYLREFCQYMSSKGAPIYAISIANEPNYSGGYDGCEWEDGQPGKTTHMLNFFLEVGQFTQGARGYGGGKSIPRVLIVNGESANSPDINFPVLNNATARAAVDFYARHVYAAHTSTLWTNPYASWEDDDPYQTECWMTEHNINSANALAFFNDSKWPYVWRFMNDVDLVIRLNNENAFVWWASKRFYSFIGDGQSGTGNGDPLPRGYGLSHFAKYTNETTRLNFTITEESTLANRTTPITTDTATSNVNQSIFNLDSPSAKITAYVKREGAEKEIKEITMVMFTPTSTSGSGGQNLGNIKINMPAGFKIDSASAHRSTSATDIFKDYPVLITESADPAVDRKSAYVSLGSGQILSVRFVVSPEGN